MLAIKRAQGAGQRWISALKNYLARFCRAMPATWREVTPDLVAGHLARIDGSRHRNNTLAAIRQFAGYCRARGWLLADPVAGFLRQRLAAADVTAYTPAEVRSILEAASPRSRPLLAMVAFCGVRLAETVRLAARDVDLERRRITIAASKAKTRSRRICPVPDNALEWIGQGLSTILALDGPLWTSPPRGIDWDMREAVRRSGVQSRQNGLRHAFLSYRLATTQSEAKTALEAGTSPAMLWRNYRDLVAPEAAAEFWSIVPGPAQIDQ
ncbi:MAG: tyrosine-type recombinase/integrase [Verrucomicrobia bacterium]|nr:tyrosine-type recombinase/integrase [Verrucomicrobiota bacterium]MBI3868830.1 tyrosine-type recombinase/integrase [Verrucomicrobiota bacterium]